MKIKGFALLTIALLCSLAGSPARAVEKGKRNTAMDTTGRPDTPRGIPSNPAEAAKTVRLVLPKSEIGDTIGKIFTRQIGQRCPTQVLPAGETPLTIELTIEEGIGSEGFSIIDRAPRTIRITGNDKRGLLYGVGKFLRTSGYSTSGLIPSTWRGVSIPRKPLRGIYFATHFHNYYHEAPIEEVKQYVEDISLWGFNVILVWFDMHHFTSIDEPNARAMLARLRILLQTAKDLGLSTAIGGPVNEGYAGSPAALRAEDSTANHSGYHTRHGNRIYNLGPELCPNKPGAMEILLKWYEEKFRVFKDVGLDYYMIWPYDSGGCTCPKCSVWGVNGLLTAAEPVAKIYRRFFPNGKVILSTWYFDRWGIGEWEGITKIFNRNRPKWADYILADDYGGVFPEYPLIHGSPGGLPMINFPEISMYLHSPWGGYGANPAPTYLQSLWDKTRDKLSGGFPYSEGLYEDMNKAICAQFYWDPNQSAAETIREYIAFYFSPTIAEPVGRAIAILEKNIERQREDTEGATRFIMKSTVRAEEAYRLISQADAQLSNPVRKSWRWRVVYLRALIDSELASHQFRVSERCEAAFRELECLYHAERGYDMVRPPANIMR